MLLTGFLFGCGIGLVWGLLKAGMQELKRRDEEKKMPGVAQTACVVAAGGEFGDLPGVIFIDGANVILRQPCSSQDRAGVLADMWRNGARHWEITAKVKEWGEG